MKALYPGSFDPITRGHLGILAKALDIFDEVEMAVGYNISKRRMYAPDEAVDFAYQAVRGWPERERISFSTYSGSLVQHAKAVGCGAVVRGLRSVTDFDDEFKLHGIVERLAPELRMVYIMTDTEFLHVSSSTAKELARLGHDTGWLEPEGVERALKRERGR